MTEIEKTINNTMITRDEFITRYMTLSGIHESNRTKDGFVFAGRRFYAIPCACGEECCGGWVRVSKEYVKEHKRYGHG